MGGTECFFFVLVFWVFSVCLHEFGHAIVAYYGGDYTVKDKGYLTLNPLQYVDPLMSIILPVAFLLMGGMGLPGGAVYIERHLLRSRNWSVAVSLAGPAMNFLLALVLCIPFWTHLVKPDPQSLTAISLAFIIQLQISAVFFNLIPVPPLDGFQAMAEWMPEETRLRMMHNSTMFLCGLFVLLRAVPALNSAVWGKIYATMDFLGIDSSLAWEGYQAFQFWN